MILPEAVIAWDPGAKRTGWASAELSENRIENLEHGVVDTGDVCVTEVAKHHDVFVYETWIPQPRRGSMQWIQGNKLIEARFIGKLELGAEQNDITLHPIDPHRKLAFVASMPAEYYEYTVRCREEHDRDALALLWGYALDRHVHHPGKVVVTCAM